MPKLDDTKPKVGRSNVRIEDLLDVYKLPPNKWIVTRLLNLDLLPVKRHWINILAGKDKREVRIPKICLSFDPKTEGTKKGVKCPYCTLASSQDEIVYYGNAIIRSLQEDEPAKAPKPTKEERKTGFKDKSSKTWTPVRPIRLTSSLALKIQELKDLNKHKIKGKTKYFSVTDDKYGCDINIKHSPDKKGAEQYQANISEKAPLTEDELSYLVYELDEKVLDEAGREKQAEAEKELTRMHLVEDTDIGEDEDDDEDGVSLSKKKKSKKASQLDDEDDEDEDDEDDEPKKKKKPVKSSKKKKSKDDEDDEDEDDEDDEDEDDEDEDEDDEDEDEDDEDDEDEDEPKKKKKSVKSSKKSSKKKSKDDDDDDDEDDDDDDDDDEDDEDDDEDDEDDDDEPRKKKKPTKSTKKRKSKDEDDEDDEDEDDEDDDDDDSDDDDDEDEPKKKKKSVKSSKKSSKGKSGKKIPW